MTHAYDHQSIETTLEQLASKHRRGLIRHLEQTGPKARAERLARELAATEHDAVREEPAVERTLIELHHTHLPALDAADIISYDPETKVVETGPAFEEAASLRRTVEDTL